MAANSRTVLAIGFGGLLLLLAFAGFDSVQKLRQIQYRNDVIRENFLARTRLLEQIRSDLYLSGTYVRDCLLEPNAAKAEAHRTSLLKTRNRMETALAGYRILLNEAQAGPFRDLNQALRDYWNILAPVLAWNAGERRDRGYAFLRDEVFPRRTAMLRIADQIAGINEAQLDAGKHEVIDMFSQFRRSSMLTIGLTIAVLPPYYSTVWVGGEERRQHFRFQLLPYRSVAEEVRDPYQQLLEKQVRLLGIGPQIPHIVRDLR